MQNLFQTLFTQPLYNLFIILYNLAPDVGAAILFITILVKLALYPLTAASIRAQKSLADLQPKVDVVNKAHAGDRQKIAEETMKLYKEHKVNPVGSCLPLLLQIPIFFALYWVLQTGLKGGGVNLLYPFVPPPASLSSTTLGLFDLGVPNYLLALLTGAAQYLQAKMMVTKQPPKEAGEGGKDESMAVMMNKQMLYLMPVMTIVIGFQMPAGLTLYWLLSTALTAAQQKLVFGRIKEPASSAGGLKN